MTDRELLELAAKAAGFSVKWHDSGRYGPTMEIMEDDSGGPPWNPLTDDGDAFRLAVKLRLAELWFTDGGAPPEVVVGRKGTDIAMVERLESDPYAATRRAIVRTAAEIGKAMA